MRLTYWTYCPKWGRCTRLSRSSTLRMVRDFAGAEKVICYYAFARYLQIADQNSTTTGMKIQTYGGSIVVPDTSKVKRFEAERGKADLFLEPLVCRMKKDGFIKVCIVQNSRIGLIK